MADPIRLMSEWPGLRGLRVLPTVTAGQIIRQDPLQQAALIIARDELRTWFEPKWRDASHLARRFRYCAVYSIPIESDTFALRRVPGWRPRPDNGTV